MKVDGVFSGGGIKAFAFLGALEACEKRDIKFERFAGTSAGALIATLLAAGYHQSEIKMLINELDTNKLLDPPKYAKNLRFLKWLALYSKMGIYRGDFIEKWINQLLLRKGIYTFNDLKRELYIIGADITNGRIALFPNDLESYYGVDLNDFPLAKAVRISISIPYFFQPVQILTKSTYKSYFIDGGTLSNFPYWVFSGENKHNRLILGVKLSSNEPEVPIQQVDNAIDMLPAIVKTMIQAHDSRYVSKNDAQDIIFVPIEKVSTTDFDLSEEEKSYLFDVGFQSAEKFFENWQHIKK
ncbi:hypothetical protein E3U55_03160 [Filobacillus milosensis]|uniref:PNPLA domain-containing protein n=1 Tax=Filobacillus milosensis TaxID=94137 RepID=A0A4Y8IQJ2_9BACI|nr:patatin-like phospholipase family protein [Filobacillus milosensis]TFB23826.1 hypothetical protein E3U55_03160 [Filobacillus milosensis]